ncbi:hypothetical protein MC885_012554 [Smutsia gigantea]|nr:hypothetical protein MC885_012554 [Smutsia gigantea]
MPPSSTLPSGRRPPSSFGSVDWLSQSSPVGPSHTSRPTEVSWGISFPSSVPGSREPPQTIGREKGKCPEVSAPRLPAVGSSKDTDPTRAPRARTAFTAEQLSTLESCFQLQHYLGPLERRRLAQEMRLPEVQIKTWFQNRRMKHKRQMQDSQLNVPFSGLLYTPLAFCPPPSALGSGLQLLYPWASLPGPLALVQPPGCSWDPCQLEQASLASTWALCNSLRPAASQAPGTRCTCWAQPCPGDPGACVPCQRLGMSSEEAERGVDGTEPNCDICPSCTLSRANGELHQQS